MTIHDISLRKLSGSKGAKSPKQTSDNLFSTDVVEVLLGISEGPIKGLKNGAKSYYIGQTTLADPNGEANFDNFELINYKGSEKGEDIFSRLGGFGASTTVNTQLASNVAVVRTGTHTQIDYLDVRFAINQLVKSTSKGTFEHTGKWKVEYKAESAANWTPVRTNEKNPLPPQISGDSFDIFYGEEGSDKNINAAPGDRPTYWSSQQPISTANAGIWFNTSNNYQPKVFNGATWSFPSNLVFANNHWTWREASSWGADKATRAFVGTKLPKGQVYEQGDYWLNTAKSQAYFFNGSSWVIAGSTLRPGTFGENGTGGSIEVQAGEISLKAKTTQVFPKEFRIPVTPIDEPYMIRVTKTSPINTTELFFDIVWESFQEVSAKAYKFPATAATQLVARASEQFSSIPDFGGIYEGRIVRVPSNYDPVARTYAGVWDGTWKLAYTNNPAFVGNDLVQNDRYGMNAYYPITLNKMDVYEAGVWCDTRVASGAPRFTFNGLISDPRGGRDALNYIFGIFAGRFFDDGNGTGVIKIDKDDGAAAIFAPENVVDGIFTYSFTETSTRHNDITVAFTNPDLQWQEDRRRVFDQDHINQYGRIPHNFIAVGCTSAEEAIRRARYHLITGIKETMMVNFKTNRMGLYMSPYDVILVSDPDMEFGLSGRVQSVTSARKIKLRDPLYFEPGFSYKISFQVISEATDDFIIESRNLVAGTTGAVDTLTVTADLPALPDDCVFTIEQTNGDSAPVAFRVMSITEVEGDPDNVEIQGMQMNRAKWLFIDGEVDTISDLDQMVLDTKKKPDPIRNLRVSAKKRRIGNRYATTITLDWDKSNTKTVSRYKIYGSRDNGPLSTLADSDVTQFEWDDIPSGEYLFQVTAIDVNGYESKPAVIEHRLIGDLTVVDDITALRLVDETSATTFERRSPTFQWGKNTSPTFEEYVVQICNTGGGLIREQFVDDPTYTYEYALNLGDNGGNPRRSFMIRVASKDQFGFLSDFEELTVSNTAPAAPATQNVILRKGVAVVKYDPPTERDFVGAVVHASSTQGFTPDASTLKYKGPNTDIPLDLDTGVNYIRLAFYDVFGDSGLKFGAEMSINVPASSDGDNIPPGKPTNFRATGGIGFIRCDWDNPTDDDLQVIELFYNTVNNLATAQFGAQSAGESGLIPGMKHGQPYFVWARAKDYDGNRSDFTDPATATPFLIDSAAIDNAVIIADKIAANAVTQGAIAANAVTAEQLAALAVNATHVSESSIANAAIIANAVTQAKLAANAVGAEQIIASSITGAKIAANTIQAGNLAANAISAGEVTAGSITTDKLAANAVTAEKILAASITAVKIAANTITAANIAANAITTNELAANAVTAANIAANAVTAAKIAANSITAVQLAANSVTAEAISVTNLAAISANLGAITGGSLSINNNFIVSSAGAVTIRNATTGQRLQITNGVITVYDSSNRLRVRLGIW
jgi:predicted phage tail protein